EDPTMFPPIPSWDGLHPLVVHFPVALLLVAPIFILIGIFRHKERAYPISALILLALGTIGAFVAVATGEAAGELAERNEAINRVLERHEHLAEYTRNAFASLTGVFLVLLATAIFLKERFKPLAWILANVVFVLLYAGAMLLLAKTAHEGGTLVHQHGVRAMIASSSGS
ncbi:MAG: DUF2231 domain-containing protein, partial [Bacillota bacterium]